MKRSIILLFLVLILSGCIKRDIVLVGLLAEGYPVSSTENRGDCWKIGFWENGTLNYQYFIPQDPDGNLIKSTYSEYKKCERRSHEA